MEQINESVLDPIRKNRCEDLFGNDTSEKPKLKKDVKDFIIGIVENFKKNINISNFDVTELIIIGSSLGYQYRDDSDIDINMRVNINRKLFKGKFSLLPKYVLLPGTQHPVNIYIVFNDDAKLDLEKNVENAYEIFSDTWLKQSSLTNIDNIPFEYIRKVSEFFIDGIVLELQRCDRDILEMKKVLSYDPNKVEITEKEKDESISRLINTLTYDRDAIRLAHSLMFRFNRDGFNDDNFSMSIAYVASNRHYGINNLIYKYIDRFGYYEKIVEKEKEIAALIKEAKNYIAKKSDNSSASADNQKEAQAEAKEAIKENFTRDEYKIILKNNGYEPCENNVDLLINGLNETYVLVDLYDTIEESVKTRTETFLNKQIYRKSGNWPKGLITVASFLFAGPVGALLAHYIIGAHNDKVNEFERELYYEIMSDPEAGKIISDIKQEVRLEQPNKEKIKSLKRHFANVVRAKKHDMKKENEHNGKEHYISLED